MMKKADVMLFQRGRADVDVGEKDSEGQYLPYDVSFELQSCQFNIGTVSIKPYLF